MRALLISLLLLAGIAAGAEVPPVTPVTPPAPETGIKAVVAVAENYLKALSAGDWGPAYDSLSSLVKNSVSKEAWISAAQEANGNVPASGSEEALARLLPGAATCRVSDIALEGPQGKAMLEATYNLPMTISLVKEGLVWKIDLLPSDRELVTAAANQLAEQIKSPASTRQFSLADRQRLLFPYITSRQVDQVELEANRAKVKFLQTATVLALLKLQRQGPFWTTVLPASPLAEPAVAPAAPPAPATAAAPAEAAPATEEAKPAPAPLPGPHHWRE